MTARLRALIGFIVCTLLIFIALYFQYVEGLNPCPLCIFQRVAFIGMGLVFLVSWGHNCNGIGNRIYGFLASICGLFGIGIAMRHLWLQHLPADQVPACGPSLSYMLEVLPLRKALETVFKGSGECAEVSWTLLQISMPGWSLIWLIILTVLALTLVFQPRKKR